MPSGLGTAVPSAGQQGQNPAAERAGHGARAAPGEWVGLRLWKADGSWGKCSPLELQPAPQGWQAAREEEEEGCGVAMTIKHLQILGLFIFGFVLAE